VQENVKQGKKGHQRGMVSLMEFGQKRIEFQKLACHPDKDDDVTSLHIMKRSI